MTRLQTSLFLLIVIALLALWMILVNPGSDIGLLQLLAQVPK